jgi:transcriptional regulator with XRE-family HTH domain
MDPVSIMMPEELSLQMGARVKALRLLAGWKRTTLAERADVTAASLRRFEQTGKASLALVLKVALSLGRLEEFAGLLKEPQARSLDELEQRIAQPARKRGVK